MKHFCDPKKTASVRGIRQNFPRVMAWIADGQQAAAMREDFAEDVAARRLIPESASLMAILEEAKRLSAKHTQAHGYRAFDFLHVAAAVTMKVGAFMSFDLNQRKLAKAAGLKVFPQAMPKATKDMGQRQ